MTQGAQSRMVDQMPLSEWAHLRTELAWVYEGPVPQEYQQMTDHIPGQSGILMLEGTLAVSTSKGQVHAGPGDWVFPRQGKRLQVFSPDARILSTHFHLHWPGGQSLFNWDVAVVVKAARYPRLAGQARKLLRYVDRNFPGAGNRLPWEQASLQSHLWMQRYFAGWIYVYVTSLLEAGVTPTRLGHVDHRVLEAIQLLDHAPLNEPMQELTVASTVGLSVSQLDRLFVRQFNLTPRQYFERRRLEAAMTHVQSSSMSMKQIAYVLGFKSLAYFSRWFRIRTGFSPRDFQKTGLLEYKTKFYLGMDTEGREVI